MFRKKQKTPSSTQGTIIIHHFEANDMSFHIDDATKGKHYHIQVEKLSAAIDKEDSIMQFDVDEKAIIHQLTFNEARGSYLENHSVEGRLKLRYNTAAKTLSCDETKLNINQQRYTISALFHLSGEPKFHIDVSTKKLSYAKGVALLTPKLRRTLSNIQLKTPLEVHAVIDGLMKYRYIPLVNINLKTEKKK